MVFGDRKRSNMESVKEVLNYLARPSGYLTLRPSVIPMGLPWQLQGIITGIDIY